MRAAQKSLDNYASENVDGWVLREQPAAIFRDGRQAPVPLLAGSTNDEWVVGYDPPADPDSVESYKAWMRQQRFFEHADVMFALYPVESDADVRVSFLSLSADDAGQAAYFMARDMTKIGQNSYLYYITYPGKFKGMTIGAYHGIELRFLAGFFRKSRWGEPTEADWELANTMRTYWTQFARTGNPNGSGLPEWPVYDAANNLCLEFGRNIRARPIPHLERYEVFDRVFKARLAEQEQARRR